MRIKDDLGSDDEEYESEYEDEEESEYEDEDESGASDNEDKVVMGCASHKHPNAPPSGSHSPL
jgi:hypothetical protein